jgi:hypothetical protein
MMSFEASRDITYRHIQFTDTLIYYIFNGLTLGFEITAREIPPLRCMSLR